VNGRFVKRFRSHPGALFGLGLLAFVHVFVLVGPLVHRTDPDAPFREALIRDDGLPVGPGVAAGHPLGGDTLGRDALARLLHGGRVSLGIAYAATLIAFAIGLFFGTLTGYFRGAFDVIVMRSIEILISLPFLLVVMVLRKVVDQTAGVGSLIAILGALSFTTLARVTRTKVMQVSSFDFVTASRALGASNLRILRRHVIPNSIGPAIAIGTSMLGGMLLAESGLSYLGLGVAAPTASWGSMLEEGGNLFFSSPRLIWYPAFFLVASGVGFALVGDGLRDALDPKEDA
jgi:ABC-type dipeptide/oligopeptide/nickel transport system permease subunit